jgi:hypothetical protein
MPLWSGMDQRVEQLSKCSGANEDHAPLRECS